MIWNSKFARESFSSSLKYTESLAAPLVDDAVEKSSRRDNCRDVACGQNMENLPVEDLSRVTFLNTTFNMHGQDALFRKRFLVAHDICLARNETGIFLFSNNAISTGVVASGTWGPWPDRLPIHVAPPSKSRSLGDYFEASLVLTTPKLNWNLNNLYHCLHDMQHAFTLVSLSRSLNSKLREALVLAHYKYVDKPGWNSTVCFQLLRSFSGTTKMFTMDNGYDGCFRQVVLEVDTPAKNLTALLPYREEKEEPGRSYLRSRWCSVLQIDCELPKTRTVTIINRLKSRKILNLGFVRAAIEEKGWLVNVLELECMSIPEQFKAIQNTTTLVGYHGAGLSWARYIHPQAAEIQLVGYSCNFESHSSMKFTSKYSILHSDLRAIGENTNQSEADKWCEVLLLKNKSASDEEFLNRHNRDVRQYDTVVDIPELIRTIDFLDPK